MIPNHKIQPILTDNLSRLTSRCRGVISKTSAVWCTAMCMLALGGLGMPAHAAGEEDDDESGGETEIPEWVLNGNDIGDTIYDAYEWDINRGFASYIQSGDDYDLYRVEIPTSGRWIVWTSTGSLDTVGYILDHRGFVLSYDDDGGAGYNFYHSVNVRSGTYYVVVGSFSSRVGPYTVYNRLISTSGFVPDKPVVVSPVDQADDHSPKLTLRGSDFSDPEGNLHYQTEWQIDDDDDFSSPVLSHVKADERYIPSDADPWYSYYGYWGVNYDYADEDEINDDWDELWTGDAGTMTTLTVPDGSLEQLTTYHARVRYRDDNDVWSDWSSPVTFTTWEDMEDGVADTLEEATLLPVNVDTYGRIDIEGDQDVYQIDLTEHGTLILKTKGGTDTVGIFYDSEGNELATDDSSGAGFNFSISAVLDPGTYYINVIGSDALTTVGAYRIDAYLFTTEFSSPDTDPADVTGTPTEVLDANTKYTGLLTGEDGATIIGALEKVKVNKNGKFSARIVVGNDRFAIKGEFDASGSFSEVVDTKKTPPLTVDLQLVETGEGGHKLVGTIQMEGEDEEYQVNTYTQGETSEFEGNYTVLIPAEDDEPDAPQGYGYALMTVQADGKAKLKGLLGDGEKLGVKCMVSADGEMLLYSGIYKRKRGFLAGEIRFRDVAGVSDCDGVVHWYKPALPLQAMYPEGFDLHRSLIGSKFVETDTSFIEEVEQMAPNADVFLSANEEEPAEVWEINWSEDNKLNYLGEEDDVKIRLITRRDKQGWLKGRILYTDVGVDENEDGEDDLYKIDIKGVVFQKQGLGAGVVYLKGEQPRGLVVVPTSTD